MTTPAIKTRKGRTAGSRLLSEFLTLKVFIGISSATDCCGAGAFVQGWELSRGSQSKSSLLEQKMKLTQRALRIVLRCDALSIITIVRVRERGMPSLTAGLSDSFLIQIFGSMRAEKLFFISDNQLESASHLTRHIRRDPQLLAIYFQVE
jgi:hypothetical protein